jgi:hypothetical protein
VCAEEEFWSIETWSLGHWRSCYGRVIRSERASRHIERSLMHGALRQLALRATSWARPLLCRNRIFQLKQWRSVTPRPQKPPRISKEFASSYPILAMLHNSRLVRR